MNEDIANLAAIVARAKSLQEDLHNLGQDIMGRAKSKVHSQPERVDLGFLFRELENLFDDQRKDAKARKELLEKLIAFEAVQTDGDVDPIRGELATGIVDLGQMVEVPKQGSEDYEQFIDGIGVPRRVCALMKLDWKAIQAHATECAEQGLPLPKGLTNPRPVYRCTFRRRAK